MAFNDIVGHEKQKQMLLSALKAERLPHAYLFAGPEGIGKKKTAKEFSKYILCETHEACGKCRPCIKVEKGSHPDVLIIENEDSIGIEQSRTIGREVYEYPYEGHRRVVLIDGADVMTHEAANALLKTLEEPPPFNIFFLVTSSEKDVPLTIRSRCARVGFSALHRDSLKQHFKRAANMGEEQAEMISYISQGSIGGGLFWAEKDNLMLRRKLAELVLGKHKSFLLVSLLSERITANQKDMAMFLSFLLSLFRDMSVVNECRSTFMIVNRDLKELLESQPVDMKWIEASIRNMQETFGILRYNVNKLLAVEALLLNITEHL